ncbi:flagellar outer dynein arm heavy chain gamma, partial [Reticulomyxa filosa]
EEFGTEIALEHSDVIYFGDFFRDDILDKDTDELIEVAPKIYELVPSLLTAQERVDMFLGKYNNEPKLKSMPLVLFSDAVKHLLRICRVLSMPRGHLLFVGIGGSGRQSLTKLAAYICRHECKQIALKISSKCLFNAEGMAKRSHFLITDSDIINEDFLEYINMVLATGMIAGLFLKEERDMMAAEIRPIAKKELADFDDSHDTLVKFLLSRIRENFHIVLAFSPANPKFAERARKFPALISGCTIDWFLRWPVDALQSVSRKFIEGDPQFEVCHIDNWKKKKITFLLILF